MQNITTPTPTFILTHTFTVTSHVGGSRKSHTVTTDTPMNAWLDARAFWGEETPSGLTVILDAKGVQVPGWGFSLVGYPYPNQ